MKECGQDQNVFIP